MKCIECKSDIQEGASLCPVCKSYQSKWSNLWRNVVPHIGIIIALFSFIASAFLYIYNTSMTVFAWKDRIRVLSFMSKGTSSYVNIGDGPIFLTDLKLITKYKLQDSPSIRTESKLVSYNRLLDKGHFLTVDEDNLSDYIFLGKDHIKEYFKKKIVLGSDGTIYFTASFKELGIEVVYFDPENPMLKNIREAYKDNFLSIPSEAIISFYSAKTGERLQYNFRCEAVLATKSQNTQSGRGLH